MKRLINAFVSIGANTKSIFNKILHPFTKTTSIALMTVLNVLSLILTILTTTPIIILVFMYTIVKILSPQEVKV